MQVLPQQPLPPLLLLLVASVHRHLYYLVRMVAALEAVQQQLQAC